MANRKSEKTTGPSQRQLRVGELIRHALAEMLARGEIHDDVLARHVVTVPEVRMSPDLRLATVYVMPLGGKDRSRCWRPSRPQVHPRQIARHQSEVRSPPCASWPTRRSTKPIASAAAGQRRYGGICRRIERAIRSRTPPP
jgi:hypothetical protein